MLRYSLLLLVLPMLAQDASMLSRTEFIENWKTSKAFTLAVAQAMPEELYKYKANPAEMNFAALMIHIADSNYFRFAQIAGDKTTGLPKPEHWSKAAIVDRLAASFDYCLEKLRTYTEAQLHQQYSVDWYERPKAGGRQILLGMYVHTAHHRAQAEVYMRANNVKPPDYRP